MARAVLGAPPKLVYSLIPTSRYSEAIDFLGKYFYTAETISKTLNLFPGGVLPSCVNKLYKHRLGYGTCMYAVEEDTKRIVGVVTTSTVTDEQNAIMADLISEMRSKDPKTWDKFLAYRKAVTNGGKSLQELTSCTKIYDMHDIVILPEYRKYGIARELTVQSIALGEQLDYEIMLGYPTTIASYKITTKLGFEVILKTMLNSIIIDGKPFSDDPEAFMAIMGYRPKKV